MDEPRAVWEQKNRRLVDMGEGEYKYTRYQFQSRTDGCEWEWEHAYVALTSFAAHYEKVKAVADAAREYMDADEGTAFVADEKLKEALKKLDEKL